MAYPTSAQLNFINIDNVAGTQPIMNTSTTQNHPLGLEILGQDIGTLSYGIGKFIYLKGVASTAAGDLVVFDRKAGTTTRLVAASRGPVAVAMSANVASQWGWYQIEGEAVVNTTAAGTGAGNAQLCSTATAGQATVRGTANQGIDGVVCKSAQDTPTTGFTQVSLAYPTMNGLT